MRPMIEQMFVGSNTRSAGDAVNNLLPSLAAGQAQPALTANGNRSSNDVPSSQSVSSNLQIVTSVSSLRSTLSRSSATSIMFTSSHCPPCNAIKPYFEELARSHRKISFCLVETQLGEGAQVARMSEFGGPVTATPTFVFFNGGEKVGECKGADKRELETRIGMLELEVFPRKCLASSVSVPSLNLSIPYSSFSRKAQPSASHEALQDSLADHFHRFPSSPGSFFQTHLFHLVSSFERLDYPDERCHLVPFFPPTSTFSSSDFTLASESNRTLALCNFCSSRDSRESYRQIPNPRPTSVISRSRFFPSHFPT